MDDLAGAKDGEVLGDGGGVDVELGLELADGELAAAEELQDVDADGVGEGLEEVGLEEAEGGAGGHSSGASRDDLLLPANIRR